MELYQVRYFLAVAETLSFTRASERVFVSQPALTKAIQRLEETLGGRLFDRCKSSVQLSEFGRAMLPSLQQIYASADQARQQAREYAAGGGETLRIGVMCTIDFGAFLAAVAGLDPEGLALSFREGNLEALSDALDRRELDAAVLAAPEPLPRRFQAEKLYVEDYVVGFGDDHRFNGREAVSLEELHREHYCQRTGCEFSDFIGRLLRDQGVQLQIVHRSHREDWVQALVRANFGVAFMPESLAQGAELAYVRTLDPPIRREVSLAVPADAAFSAGQQRFLDRLLAHTWELRTTAPRAAPSGPGA